MMGRQFYLAVIETVVDLVRDERVRLGAMTWREERDDRKAAEEPCIRMASSMTFDGGER